MTTRQAKYRVKTQNGYEKFHFETHIDIVEGSSAVAKTGDYNDLLNKPEGLGYVHPIVKKCFDLGDGAKTSFSVAHGFGTDDLFVTIKEKTTGQVVYVDCFIGTENITINFPTAPTTNQYRLVILNG